MKPIYIFVTPFFPSARNWRGGYCYDMVRALMRTGAYDIRVLTVSTEKTYVYHGVPVFGFRRIDLPCGLAPFATHKINAELFLSALKRNGINPLGVAFCHVHTAALGYVGTAMKRINPKTYVLLHYHCISPIRLVSGRLGILPLHATMLYFYYCWMCDKIDAHVFCSQKSLLSFGKTCKEGIPENGFVDIRQSLFLGALLPALYAKKKIVYYNGYDPEVFHPLSPVNGFTIGCVANFQPLKDIPTLIRAFKIVSDKIPDARLRLVGSGETKADCVELAKELGLSDKVSFEVEIDHLALPEFYRSLGVFALPSRTEGFCCSYIEALGCGIPVFGCKGVSISEAIVREEHDRWLSAAQDEKALSRNILAYFANRSSPKLTRAFDTNTLAKEFVAELEGGLL